MKSHAVLPMAMMLLALCYNAVALELPTQKPGLWQTTMTGKKIPGGSRTFNICFDAASLAEAKATTDAHLKNDCSASVVRKEGDIWIADSTCTFSGKRVVGHTETVFTGDDMLRSQVTSSYGSNKEGASTTVMTVDSKFLGPCVPGQKVGVPEAQR
jgi:uncharacterized protein DUF3617